MPFFSRPRHSTSVERRPVCYLPALGFFRLPRGFPRRLLSDAYKSQMKVASVKPNTVCHGRGKEWQRYTTKKTICYTVGLAVRIVPTIMRTFTKDTALSEHGRDAACMCELTHGMGVACYVWTYLIVSSGMEELPSQNMPVRRLKLAFLPLDLFALLYDHNPFRGFSNYWQVTQEEARRIIPSSVLDEVKLACLYASHEDTMENVSTYSSILFQPGQWMVVNLELPNLAVLTPRKKPPLSSRMVGGPQNRSGQCGEKEI